MLDALKDFLVGLKDFQPLITGALAIIAAGIAYRSLQRSVSKQINAARTLADQQYNRQQEKARADERRQCSAILITFQIKLNGLRPHIGDWVTNLQEIQRESIKNGLIYRANSPHYWDILERLRPIRAQSGLAAISLNDLSVLEPSEQAMLQAIIFRIDTCDTLVEMARSAAISSDKMHEILFAREIDLLVAIHNDIPGRVGEIGERLKNYLQKRP